MSLFSELVDIYNDNVSQIGKENDNTSPALLPISHTKVKILFQINLDKNGNFLGAEVIDKNDAKTIVPTTVQSAARTSGMCPMPVDDKLKYVASDYYLWSKKKKDQTFYSEYVTQLKEFTEYVNKHCDEDVKTEINAIYRYVSHSEILHDLCEVGLFGEKIDFSSIPKIWKGADKPRAYKEATGNPTDSFVRFNIRGVRDFPRWNDKKMFDAWIEYYNSLLEKEDNGIDYVTGKTKQALTQIHPKGILPAESNAKLISANDTTNYTFRGRFLNANEAATISYENSQKANLALRWMIEKDNFSVGGRYYLSWGARENLDTMGFDNELLAAIQEQIELSNSDSVNLLTYKIKDVLLKGKNTNLDDLVHILELDTSTPGRIDIVYYQTIDLKSYIDKLNNWYSKTYIDHLTSKYRFKNKNLWQIARMVRGEHVKEELLKNTVSELSELILGSQHVPTSILMPLYNRAIRPLNFDLDSDQKKISWNIVLETTASLFKANDSELTSVLNDKLNDRGYLFGRLLAIANQVEMEVLQTENNKAVYTNAQRYMSKMPVNPIGTWKNVYVHLEPYLEKYQYANKARKLINYITSKLVNNLNDYEHSGKAFSQIEAGRFLIGFVQQKYAWFDSEFKYDYHRKPILPITDREYLLGRLLSIADTIEYQALKERENDDWVKIVTNVDRYLNAFVHRPLDIWKNIYLHLQPYLVKSENYKLINLEIDNIINLFQVNQNTSRELNKPLTGKFLVGFSQEKRKIGKLTSNDPALNENLMDRNYLYGRLLAIADVIENREQIIHHIKRPTNAMRYLSAFAQSPDDTWKTIWDNTKKYVKSISQISRALDVIDEVNGELRKIQSCEKNSPLNGLFLLGFSQQKSAWYGKERK